MQSEQIVCFQNGNDYENNYYPFFDNSKTSNLRNYMGDLYVCNLVIVNHESSDNFGIVRSWKIDFAKCVLKKGEL